MLAKKKKKKTQLKLSYNILPLLTSLFSPEVVTTDAECFKILASIFYILPASTILTQKLLIFFQQKILTYMYFGYLHLKF